MGFTGGSGTCGGTCGKGLSSNPSQRDGRRPRVAPCRTCVKRLPRSV